SSAGVRAPAYTYTGYVSFPAGTRNDAIANSSNEIVNAISADENRAGTISGSVIRRKATKPEAPRSRAASTMSSSSVRRRGRMIRIEYGTATATWPRSTAHSAWCRPSEFSRISIPTASTTYGTTSGSSTSAVTTPRNASFRAVSPTAVVSPSSVAPSAQSAPITALRSIAEIRSPFENADRNQCVVNPEYGSVWIVESSNEKTTSTTSGT